MIRYLWILTAMVFMASASAQDADPDTGDEDTVEDAAPEPEQEPVEYDETGLDEQGFADEDDDFDPTEVIPTDQSIDFPADI
ncbi:MAG: hypothetical protein QNI96_03280 [Woeseiaceae bacterium]|nr:hypothetical protein [Woeseiaceae bacterium]